MRTGFAAVALLGATSLLGRPARAAGAEVEAERLVRAAQADEDAGDFAQALLHDRAAVAAAPESEWAQRAGDRIAWLTAHSEGDFVPLARLERVRQSPALAGDPGAIESLAREAASFPPGPVRVEARMLAAEAWLGRLHRPDEALALLRAVGDDPAADPLTIRLAEQQIVSLLTTDGRLDEAAAEADTHADRLDARFVKQTRALVRRRTIRRAALVELVGVGVLAAIALVRAFTRGALGEVRRPLRRFAPVAIAFVAYLVGAGGMLASSYETGNAAPFVFFGLSVLPLLFVARAWGAVGSPGAAARTGRAVLCAVGVLAAAFLLLDAVNPTYLEGFGL